MRKMLLALPLLALVLASCSGSITVRKVYYSPVSAHENGATTLTVYPLFVETDWRDEDGFSYVCDDRPTTLTYGFRYDGDLASWTYQLDGESTDSPVDTVSFSTPGVTRYGSNGQYVSAAVQYAPGASPRSLAVRPQSIVITPPSRDEVGSVRLVLSFKTSTGGTTTFVSPRISVLSNCD